MVGSSRTTHISVFIFGHQRNNKPLAIKFSKQHRGNNSTYHRNHVYPWKWQRTEKGSIEQRRWREQRNGERKGRSGRRLSGNEVIEDTLNSISIGDEKFVKYVPCCGVTLRTRTPRQLSDVFKTRTTHLYRVTFVLMRSNTVKLPTSETVHMLRPRCSYRSGRDLPRFSAFTRIELAKYICRERDASHATD